MTDEITAEVSTTEMPAEMPAMQPMPAAEPAADDAPSRLRAFEDKIFGPEAVRFEGKIERGIGSRFSLMDEMKKAEHAALERLVEAEQKLLKATAALSEAKDEFTAAMKAADAHAAQ